jgi:hydrogenase expression/formation protein HypE
MLGLDPLYVANEGKLVAIVAPEGADAAVRALGSQPLGLHAAVIGEVVEGKPGRVIMRTRIGPSRLVGMLTGELLPRIC